MSYLENFQQLAKMLKNLAHFLDRGLLYAEGKKFDVNVLLQARLAPDQFPLAKQVQIACDGAKYGAARLAGKEKEAPVHNDQEQSFADLKKRIDSVISYLSTFKESDFANASERHISLPRWDGKYMLGKDYLYQYLVPNAYFHVTTAYSILRHNGVDLGKADYLGELPYKH